MDYKKIEIIFLSVFAVLDIFLLIIFLQTPSFSAAKSVASHDIQTEMRADNISTGSVSAKNGTGYYLAGKLSNDWTRADVNLHNQTLSYQATVPVLNSKLQNPISYDGQGDLIAKLNKFKNQPENVINGTDYDYSKELSTKNEIVFLQDTKHGKIADENGRLTFEISGGKVDSYTQNYQTSLEIVREKQETISAKEAIENLYMVSELPNDSKIISKNLGYIKLTQVKNSLIFVPVWVIQVENKNTENIQIKRVNAFDGTVISEDHRLN